MGPAGVGLGRMGVAVGDDASDAVGDAVSEGATAVEVGDGDSGWVSVQQGVVSCAGVGVSVWSGVVPEQAGKRHATANAIYA